MFEKNINYGLHDTSVHGISIEDGGLSFSFENGVYILNDEGRETVLSNPCKMLISIENFDKNSIFEHCSFYKCRKNRIYEVDFADIQKLLLKNCFSIDSDFYSPFLRAISLRGYIGKYRAEILITEVRSVEFKI